MMTMRTMVLAAIFAVGCGSEMAGPMDSGHDTGPDVAPVEVGHPDVGSETGPGATYQCGQAPGKQYTAKFVETSGACLDGVVLDITIGNLNDFCDSIGQTRTGVFGPGLCDVGCWIDSSTCKVFAAVGCGSCQGGYTIKLAEK